jgi:hypothetical protein
VSDERRPSASGFVSHVGRQDLPLQLASRDHLLAPLAKTQLAYRLVARARQASIGRPGPRGAAVVASVGAVIDVAGFVLARRWGKPSFLTRGGLNLVEQSIEAARSEQLDPAVLLGLPVSAEAGIRFGMRGVVLPIANLAGALAARRARGVPTPSLPHAFQVLATATGAALRRYDDRRVAQLRDRLEAALAADDRRARVAGAHSVAMGADSVVDLAVRTAPLLGEGATRSAGRSLHTWKASLTSSTRQGDAGYLADALRRWERAHNRTSPVLAHDVCVRVVDGDRVLLLPTQEEHLLHELDKLDLSGDIVVAPSVGQAHVPGRPLQLDLQWSGVATTVAIPPAAGMSRVAALNPAPFAPAMMVLWLGAHALRGGEQVPLRWVVPGSVLAASCTIRALQQSLAEDERASRETLLACTAIALAHTAVVTPRVRADVTRDGLQPHPFASAIWAPLFLMAAQGSSIGSRAEACAWTGLGLTAVVGLSRYPMHIRWLDVALSVHLSAVAYVSVRGWERALQTHAARIREWYEDERGERTVRAFRRGADEVVARVSGLVDELEVELRIQPPDGDPVIRAEAERRVAELRRRLSDLRDPTGGVNAIA